MLKRLVDQAQTPCGAASDAGLRYVGEDEPGWTRRGAGKGFYYLDLDGQRIADRDCVKRLRALAIPPAWRDIWICPDPRGHIQATGRDARGRKQYRYHPLWAQAQEEQKFASLGEFGHALPALRAQVDADLRRHGVPRARVMATVVRLLDIGLIRIGNDRYAAENRSYGVTTLRARHVTLDGSNLRFAFTGKSGKEWKLRVHDRRIATALRSIQDLPGQRLFRYLDEDGKAQDLLSQDVNAYIRAAAGEAFSSKHFRPWGGSVQALGLLADLERPEGKNARARALNTMVAEVATQLRNTRAVCRRSYIHPAIVAAWEDGALASALTTLRRRTPRPLKGLDAEESLFLRWLDRNG
ncbi:DNA topoisomerase IB [Rhodobacter sp. NTK016B]|uniref:DNA topoisomerase IB n=1 Tax=Rhodobacter sp. NTK016B TaxID=2759676 RepID=UPI001A8E9B44|nr:DNA topoisomerase IB [Rhodobacter sp. NTK016B]MBN8290623.1 DNA topoisomerase IB [Rhodobacter sp. NTK016B]